MFRCRKHAEADIKFRESDGLMSRRRADAHVQASGKGGQDLQHARAARSDAADCVFDIEGGAGCIHKHYTCRRCSDVHLR